MKFFTTVWHVMKGGLSLAQNVEQGPLAPFVNLIPGANVVLGAMASVETLIGPGNGDIKQAAALSLVNTIHPGMDQDKLKTAINNVVATQNSAEAAIADVEALIQSAKK